MANRIVLHIDDDEDDRILVKEAVSGFDKNINFIEATNGKEGLQKLLEFKNLEHLPCLIFLDLNMPLMSAEEVLQQIRKDQKLANIPLIIFSTSSSAADKELAGRHGVEFVTKPTSYEELLSSIKRALDHCPG